MIGRMQAGKLGKKILFFKVKRKVYGPRNRGFFGRSMGSKTLSQGTREADPETIPQKVRGEPTRA